MTNVKSRREFLCDSTLIAGSLIAAGSVSAGVKSASKGNLQVGACVTDVSPQTYPVAVNGGFSPRFYKENSDPTCVRAYSPFEKTFVIGLANGYNGYLPTTEQFELGGYSTWRGTSYLEKLAEPKIRAELLAMLKELAKP